jgi:tRNA uridine 5-carbamoylmethylation protein Kti12
MDLQELLCLVDELVFTKTGKHLDNLQQAILKGTIQGKKYLDIAQEEQYTRGHIRDVASELWKILSEELDADIRKSNVMATLERLHFLHRSHIKIQNSKFGNINVCRDNLNSNSSTFNPDQFYSQSLPKKSCVEGNFIDLIDAPEINQFYGRTEQLEILQNLILKENKRLITIAGIIGIGKTSLAVHLVKLLQDQFDYVIWRSLINLPTLEQLQISLLQCFTNSENPSKSEPKEKYNRESLLFQKLSQFRCLIIIDDLQSLFESEKLSGEYQSGYENYGLFFEKIATIKHQSSFIINSRQIPREIVRLSLNNFSVALINLQGLGIQDAEFILERQNLRGQEKWSSLINLFEGNPLWLNLISGLIKDLFSNKVTDYFKVDEIILGQDLQSILDSVFKTLSKSEKQILILLSQHNQPLTISTLFNNQSLSKTELLNVIQSLMRRFLIQKQEQDQETTLSLTPIIKYSISMDENQGRK